jgi:hypothetical protein
MPQSCDMRQTALLPLRKKACCGFFRPKNPMALAGIEPAILGTKGKHANHKTTEAACTPIRNCGIIKQLTQCPSNSKRILPFRGRVFVFVLYWEYDCFLSCWWASKNNFADLFKLFLHLRLHASSTLVFHIFQDGVNTRSIWTRS